MVRLPDPATWRFKAAGDRYLSLPEFIDASYAVYDKTPREKLVISSPNELEQVMNRILADRVPA